MKNVYIDTLYDIIVIPYTCVNHVLHGQLLTSYKKYVMTYEIRNAFNIIYYIILNII